MVSFIKHSCFPKKNNSFYLISEDPRHYFLLNHRIYFLGPERGERVLRDVAFWFLFFFSRGQSLSSGVKPRAKNRFTEFVIPRVSRPMNFQTFLEELYDEGVAHGTCV